MTIRAKALQVVQLGLMYLCHLLNMHCMVMDFDTSCPMRTTVDINRVHAAPLTGKPPMGAQKPIFLRLCQS
jgi:hypothetical protein